MNVNRIGIGENEVVLGKGTTIEQIIVDYNLNEVNICFVKSVTLTRRAQESSFLKLNKEESKITIVGEFLLKTIITYKPKKVIIGSIGFGIGVWDYIIDELVDGGVYINKDGETSYGLSYNEIFNSTKRDENVLYERYFGSTGGNEVIDLLDFSYKNGVLIKLTNERLRGMGKTTALLLMAEEKKLSIITTSLSQFHDLVEKREKLNLKLRNNITFIGEAKDLDGRALEYPNFIIDEGADMDIIKNIIKSGVGNLVGGWERI